MITEKPVVSVIVPCYNQGQYLDDALRSIFDQSYTNWECFIINDGSPDNTEAVGTKWTKRDVRFKYIYKQNGGTSSAKNAGILLAKGEYIQILDADDLLEKNKLLFQLECIKNEHNHSSKLITYTSTRYFRSTNPSDLSIYGRDNFLNQVEITKYDPNLLRTVFVRNPFVICTPLFPKKMFDEIGLYDITMHGLEDWDLHLRAVEAGYLIHYLGYVPGAIALVRVHTMSAMHNYKALSDGMEKLRLKHLHYDTYNIWGPLPVETQILKQSTFLKILKYLCPPIILMIVKKIIRKP